MMRAGLVVFGLNVENKQLINISRPSGALTPKMCRDVGDIASNI